MSWAKLAPILSSKRFITPTTSSIGRALTSLGSPHRDLESNSLVVHVAGTNGKGSTCAMLYSVLTQAGITVGMFTSPWLVTPSDALFTRRPGPGLPAARVCDVEYSEAVGRAIMAEGGLSEFEALTAAALQCLARASNQVNIIECGMGGLHDCTNVFTTPALTVVTGVSLDHTEFLGPSLMDVARHKFGIARPGAPMVVGNGAAPYMGMAQEMLHEGKIKQLLKASPTHHLATSLEGAHQQENASTVQACVSALRASGLSITEGAVARGLACATWECRLEHVAPNVVVDGAHNAEGMEALSEYLRSISGKYTSIVLLTACMQSKPTAMYSPLLRTMAECFGTVNVVATSVPEMYCELQQVYGETKRGSRPASTLASELVELLRAAGAASAEVSHEADYRCAVRHAARGAREGVLVLVAGSLYLAGPARALLCDGPPPSVGVNGRQSVL